MPQPLVSIITPTYNTAATFPETAASVLAQTFTDWEWVIVDDTSTDPSQDLNEKLASENSKVKTFCQNQRGFPVPAREAALRRAQGRFVAFIDADDLWLPTKLERQLSFMLQHDVPLSYTAYRRINEDGSHIGRVVNIPQRLTYQTHLKNTAIACSTVMIDRSLTGDFSMVAAPSQDFATWLSILKRGHTAYGLSEDLMRYRIRKGSMSSNKWKSIQGVWGLYRQPPHELSIFDASYCLANYGANAVLKRIGF